MSKNLHKLGRSLGLVIAFFVVFEGIVFLRWIFFSGPEPSLRNLQTGLGILIAIWAASKLAGWFERREARDNEIADNVRYIHARFADMDAGIADKIRNMDTRIEAFYKWGPLRFSDNDDQNDDDWESGLDDETKAKIAEYREGINSGDSTSRYSLGVLFWNGAMPYYNSHTKDGYRDAIRWLRKAASVDYDCENTLGDAYIELQDYHEAMYWYRRSVKRGGSLVGIAESNIADTRVGNVRNNEPGLCEPQSCPSHSA